MGTLSPWPENQASKKKRLIEELVEGQECASQLQILFSMPSQESGHLSSAKKLLVEKILRSFNQTLAVLSTVESPEVSQNQTASNDDFHCFIDQRSEDSSESRKRPASKDRRGCYKRKRAAQAWTVVSATMEDGHAWRKYGQKGILNSKYPRSYFRCTRKYDQGCRATKQVQRMEDGSQMYRTTYIGTHTCMNYSFKAPQIIKDSEPWETCMVDNDDLKIPIKKHHDQYVNLPLATLTVKQETKEETSTTPSDLTDLDSILWKDLMAGGLEYFSEPPTIISNVYPSTEISSWNFKLD